MTVLTLSILQSGVSPCPTLKIILILLLAYLVVYGIGVGNFGTGIRHRSKFAIIFIILAAPLLPKIILNIKNKLHN